MPFGMDRFARLRSALSRGTRAQRLRLALFVGVGLATTGIALVAFGFDLLKGQELSTVDARFSIRGTQAVPKDIVLVQIDDVTFSDLQLQWPFPRTVHAQAIRKLKADGAKVIAFDVQFSEPSNQKADEALATALYDAGNVVLAATEVDEHARPALFGIPIGKDLQRQLRTSFGSANFPPERDGSTRRLLYAPDGLTAFGIVAAERAFGHTIDRSDLGGPTAWIDFRGPPGTMKAYSYSRVEQGKFPRGTFKGKVVVIGPSAPTLHDLHTVPTGDNMAGAEVEGNAIWTALHGFPLRSSSTALAVFLIVLLGLLPPLIGLRLSILWSIVATIAVGVGYVVATQLLFDSGTIISFVYPMTALALSFVGSLGAHYATAAFERERVREVFSRFVPDTVIDQVLAHTGSDLRLGGETVNGTIMFTDLRGFTSFSESLPPHEVIEVVNRLLGEQTETILAHGGTIISYLGDGIMAAFGAPIAMHDHADRAVAASREMIADRLPLMNEWMREQGYGQGFRMGIGLNSGEFISGNVGSEQRLEYTAIGDVCNTAARIQDLTKGTRHMLMLSESTRAALELPPDDLVDVGDFAIRGRQAQIKLWSLEAVSDPAPAEPVAAPATRAS